MRILLKYSPVLLYFLLVFFTYLMVRITLPYAGMNSKEGFLTLKQSIITNRVWLWAFYIHVFTSCFLLLAGFTQFSPKILKNRKGLHRSIGKLYVIILLFISGPAGFIMALYANGGPFSRAGFIILSVLWLFTTAMAWYYVIKKDFKRHRDFMILSFSLTVSALTLRLWKYGIAFALHPHPMDVYRIVAWLGWVPNFLLGLWIIRRK